MNYRAEQAFIKLPVAIDEFDKTEYRPSKWGISQGFHPNQFEHLRIDCTYLLGFYVEQEYLTPEQGTSIKQLLRSVNRQDWFMAFTILHETRHRMWDPEDNPPDAYIYH